jgi:heme/copper-type cytochrome/quinol oxidase subunit 2
VVHAEVSKHKPEASALKEIHMNKTLISIVLFLGFAVLVGLSVASYAAESEWGVMAMEYSLMRRQAMLTMTIIIVCLLALLVLVLLIYLQRKYKNQKRGREEPDE